MAWSPKKDKGTILLKTKKKKLLFKQRYGSTCAASSVLKSVKTVILPGMDHRRSPSHSRPWRHGTVPRCGPSHESSCFDGPECQSRKGSEPYPLKKSKTMGIKLVKAHFRVEISRWAHCNDKMIWCYLQYENISHSHFVWLIPQDKSHSNSDLLSSKVLCFPLTFMASSSTSARYFTRTVQHVWH